MNTVVLPVAGHAPGTLLSDQHHRLERKCRDMIGWAYTDDARDLGSAWEDLEAELLDHMAAEEEVIIPSYAMQAPQDASRIRDEHAQIRSLLTPIGIDVELHQIRVARLRRLVETLESHSASEDAAMYPWASEHIPLVGERLLSARIERWCARSDPT